jgi:transposase InsO family protein
MTKAEQARLVNWRSKILQHAKEVTGNVAQTCRHFGLSRKAYYKWKKRFDEHGDVGLADRSRKPLRSPRAKPPEVVSKILYLRQNYHFGPGKISDYLARSHHLSVAASSVHQILLRHGLNRLPANQKYRQYARRWQRYEKAQPGHRLQMDVKFLERIPGTKTRLYQFTAIDDCTRIRVLKVYDACSQSTAISFVDDVIRRLPFRIHVVQTDNGAEFQSKFHWHLQVLDIRHVYIRPRTPRLNGKVERSHRVDDQEFYQLLDTVSATTSISSTRSCASGRTTTTTTDPTELWVDRRPMNGYWPRREAECHRRPRKLHPRLAADIEPSGNRPRPPRAPCRGSGHIGLVEALGGASR